MIHYPANYGREGGAGWFKMGGKEGYTVNGDTFWIFVYDKLKVDFTK